MIFSPLPIRSFRLTQKFGARPEVYAQFGHKGHNGLDFAPLIPGMKGVVVYAPHEGYVKCFKNDPGYGNYVEIDSLPYQSDKTCRRSDLCHLEAFKVKDGQYVAAGEPIGVMGKTGFADGIHLHWTYKRIRDGVVVDYNNGFHGAIDISRYVLPLVLQPLVR